MSTSGTSSYFASGAFGSALDFFLQQANFGMEGLEMFGAEMFGPEMFGPEIFGLEMFGIEMFGPEMFGLEMFGFLQLSALQQEILGALHFLQQELLQHLGPFGSLAFSFLQQARLPNPAKPTAPSTIN
jgi:hypothetical protein